MGVFSNIKRFKEAKDGFNQGSQEEKSGTVKRMVVVVAIVIVAILAVKGIAYICAE